MTFDDEVSMFKKLDHHVRAYALVGYFLQNFAHMEQCLDALIEHALGLDSLQALVLGKNIEVGRKLSIAKVLVDLSAHDDSEAKSLLTKIHKFIEDRNIVAHDMFMPDARDEGDIQFVNVEARTKLKLPVVVWSVEQVVHKATAMLKTADALVVLAEKMKKPVLDGIDVYTVNQMIKEGREG